MMRLLRRVGDRRDGGRGLRHDGDGTHAHRWIGWSWFSWSDD
jgi:hypothetical protein